MSSSGRSSAGTSGAYAPLQQGFTSVGPFGASNPMAQTVIGIDATDDRLFAQNGTDIVMSADRGVTFGNGKGVPTNVAASTLKKILRWGAKVYTIGFNSVSSRVELYSATPQAVLNAAFTWSAALLQLTAGSTSAAGFQMNGSAWGDARDALIVLDYGPDPIGGPSASLSTDGSTFTRVLGPIAGTRHFHHIWWDPWRPGHWWLTAGDGTGFEFYRSTDWGLTWTLITTSTGSTADLSQAAWQAVQISGDANSIYFCGDSGYYSVMKMRRTDIDAGIYKPVIAPRYHQHLHIPNGRPPRGPFADGVLTAGTKTLGSATANITADDVGKILAFTVSTNPGGYPSGQPLRIWIASFASTTIAAGSNATALPQSTINVASASALASAGTAMVTTDAGVQVVTYTGKTGTTLTGCTGGTGTMSTGGAVTQAVLNAQANSTATAVSFLLSGDVLFHGAFWGAVDPATGIVYQLANDATSSGTRAGLFATLPDGSQILLESWGPSYSAEVFIYQGYVYCGRMKRPLLTLGQWAA